MLHAAVTRAFEDDQVADLDRMEELQAVDGGGHQQAAGVTVAGDGAGDVDQVHDGAAEDEPERVRVVRQDDLHHLRRGLGRPACGAVSQLFWHLASMKDFSVSRSSGGSSSSRRERSSETVDS